METRTHVVAALAAVLTVFSVTAQAEIVPLSNSEILTAALQETGVTHELLVIEGGDHGFRNPDHRAEATTAMVAWFKQHLRVRATN